MIDSDTIYLKIIYTTVRDIDKKKKYIESDGSESDFDDEEELISDYDDDDEEEEEEKVEEEEQNISDYDDDDDEEYLPKKRQRKTQYDTPPKTRNPRSKIRHVPPKLKIESPPKPQSKTKLTSLVDDDANLRPKLSLKELVAANIAEANQLKKLKESHKQSTSDEDEESDSSLKKRKPSTQKKPKKLNESLDEKESKSKRKKIIEENIIKGS